MQPLSPLIKRTSTAKSLGFVFGLVGFAVIRLAAPETPILLAWGWLALTVTIGGIVGIIGLIDRIPLLDWPLPAWLRGGMMGAWMVVLVLLFGYPVLVDTLNEVEILPDAFKSPLWIILDGFLLGAMMDVIVTAWRGSGTAKLLAH